MNISIIIKKSSAYNAVRIILLLCLILLTSPCSYAEEVKNGNNSLQKGNYSSELQEIQILAEQGKPEAQFKLGFMYYAGKGVIQDTQQAFKWFSKAAEQGIPQAQFFIGVMYDLGQGITTDSILSHMWLNIAGSNGDKGAIKYRDLVAEKMSKSQIEKALAQGHPINVGLPEDWLSVSHAASAVPSEDRVFS